MAFDPIDAATACIRRSRRLLSLADNKLGDAKVKNDLRRAALVMGVTAVDSYMHWLVYRRVSDVRNGGDFPKSLAKLDMPFGDIASLADAAIEGRREKRDIRPWVQVKNAMQRRLLRETFQSYEQVRTAFALAGIEKAWSRVAGQLGAEAKTIKTRLNHLVHRRNQIVHEGDIMRASRPRKLKYNDVEHEEIAADVDWVEELIAAIEEVVAQELT